MAQDEQKELKIRFNHHAPKPEQIPVYERVRAEALHFAQLVIEVCPEGREKSLAMTKIEEAVMWANSAIARRS